MLGITERSKRNASKSSSTKVMTSVGRLHVQVCDEGNQSIHVGFDYIQASV